MDERRPCKSNHIYWSAERQEVFRDITERKLAEKTALQEEKGHLTLAESAACETPSNPANDKIHEDVSTRVP